MDGTHITALRTAGGAALSAQLLARPDAHTLAIIGGGVQGIAHAHLMPLVRDVIDIRVWSRSPESSERVAAVATRSQVVATAEEAVRDADIVCLCTSAQEPPVRAEWIAPGAHVTSVGFNPPGGELDPALIERGRLFVESADAFLPPPVGNAELQGLDPAVGTEWLANLKKTFTTSPPDEAATSDKVRAMLTALGPDGYRLLSAQIKHSGAGNNPYQATAFADPKATLAAMEKDLAESRDDPRKVQAYEGAMAYLRALAYPVATPY